MTAVLKIDCQYVKQLIDVQADADQRRLPIQKVGIKDLTYPVIFTDREGSQQTRATCNLYVSLSADQRGTHMSRFISLMNENNQDLSVDNFRQLLETVAKILDADSSRIEIDFTYFKWKNAPVSGIRSAMDYHVYLAGDYADGKTDIQVKVEVPATSLCPCSKKISDFGAHNQRSLITITVQSSQTMMIEEIIEIAEKNASAEVYGLVKREDEKYLTEHAYQNPKFVEDMVRDIALCLQNDERITGFVVETENFESIHNHSAYAMIDQLNSSR